MQHLDGVHGSLVEEVKSFFEDNRICMRRCREETELFIDNGMVILTQGCVRLHVCLAHVWIKLRRGQIGFLWRERERERERERVVNCKLMKWIDSGRVEESKMRKVLQLHRTQIQSVESAQVCEERK